MPGGPAGRRQNFARANRSRGPWGGSFEHVSLGGMHDEAELRGHRADVHRRHAGPHLAGDPPRRRQQSGDDARRGGQARPRLSRRPGGGAAGDSRSGAEQHLPRQLFRSCRSICRRCFSSRRPTRSTPCRGRCWIAWRFCGCPATATRRRCEIARRYLVPRQLSQAGLTAEQVQFPDETIRVIIRRYTREAGVRQLEQSIGRVTRKVAFRFAQAQTDPVVVQRARLGGFARTGALLSRASTHAVAARRGRRPGLDGSGRRSALRRGDLAAARAWVAFDGATRRSDARVGAGGPKLSVVACRGDGHRSRVVSHCRRAHSRPRRRRAQGRPQRGRGHGRRL